jgi:SAM-dependent methyltransferase
MKELGNALNQIKKLFFILDQSIIKKGRNLSKEEIAIFQQSFHEFIYLANEKIGLNSNLDYFTKQKTGSKLQQEILPYILLTNTAERFYSKPHGYAGDYKTIDMIYGNIGKGHGRIGNVIDQFFLETPAAQAVRNRRGLLLKEISNTIDTANGKIVKIASLACGPSKEIFDIYQSIKNKEILKTTLLDFDEQAIKFLRDTKRNNNLEGQIKLIQENLLHIALGRKSIDMNNKDLIYSLGLIDYLQDKAVIKLLNWIHQVLKLGGRVILGNFHPNNPCKVFMDYIFEWKLIHRDEEEISNIFKKSAFNCTPTRIFFEDQGINMFVDCIKS